MIEREAPAGTPVHLPDYDPTPVEGLDSEVLPGPFDATERGELGKLANYVLRESFSALLSIGIDPGLVDDARGLAWVVAVNDRGIASHSYEIFDEGPSTDPEVRLVARAASLLAKIAQVNAIAASNTIFAGLDESFGRFVAGAYVAGSAGAVLAVRAASNIAQALLATGWPDDGPRMRLAILIAALGDSTRLGAHVEEVAGR